LKTFSLNKIDRRYVEHRKIPKQEKEMQHDIAVVAAGTGLAGTQGASLGPGTT
jgi:hypothetical protein